MYATRLRFTSLLLVALAGCSSDDEAQQDEGALTQSHWSVNDVSYLFPLPKSEAEGSLLLKLDRSGKRGALFPSALYEEHVEGRFGGLWEGFFREDGYAWSRIVAMRVDPCGGETVVDANTECQAELRLSVQPLDASGESDPMTSTVDAAIHLVYELTAAELDAMLGELLALRKKSKVDTKGAPLGPHPIMVAEGLAGPFAKGLNKVILKYAGENNLVKFTLMPRGRNSTNWRFLQLVRGDDGKYDLAVIPATGDATVQGVNEIGLEGENNSRETLISPVDPKVGYPEALLKSEEAKKLSATKLKTALGRLASFEDPAKHSALTLDCGSCHAAGNARSFFEELTGVTTPSKYLTFSAPDGQNVERVDETGLSGKSMRAFGYFSRDVAISQRTVNESARVADWLTRGGP